MKQILSIIMFFLCINVCSSQNLNIKFLEQISQISFWSIDDIMIKGNGFTEMTVEQERTKKYSKVINDNINNFISISILNTANSSRHTLDITVASNYSMKKFKNSLVKNDYLYRGANDYGFLVYKKEKVYLLVAEKPNSAGAHQVLLTIKE